MLKYEQTSIDRKKACCYACHILLDLIGYASKIVNEYDQEIPQSQTADNPVAP